MDSKYVATIFLLITLATALTKSPDGSCGGTKQYTCAGLSGATCCSQWGWCGATDGHCGTGCQSKFGECKTSGSGGSTSKVSQDGTCGGTNGYTCLKSTFGSCCSKWGYCGSTTGHCGSGCQSSYGTCTASGSSKSPTSKASNSANPTSTPGSGAKVTTDGSCGGTNGYTCAGSTFGNCCSKSGWCGSEDTHCGYGCQSSFGTCPTIKCPTCSGTVSANPICSDNDGYCYTVNQKSFTISCNGFPTGTSIGYNDASTLGDCISACAKTDGCVAAGFYKGSTTSCSLWSSYTGPSYNSAGGTKAIVVLRGSPSTCT